MSKKPRDDADAERSLDVSLIDMVGAANVPYASLYSLGAGTAEVISLLGAASGVVASLDEADVTFG